MTASSDAERPRNSRFPDFFIVGHPKSGTTALYGMLRSHPRIYMPHKELWFFAMAPGAPTPPRPVGSGRTPVSVEEYLSRFDGAAPEQLLGDYSTSYLVSHHAAARIAEAQPAGRVIALFREPAGFLRSLHLQLLQNHVETERDLRKAIGHERDRREGRNLPRNAYWLQATQYSEHVRYAEQLRRYHEHFGQEQVLALIYDDFRTDNEATVQRIQNFLGLDSRPVTVREANPSVRVRGQPLYELIHAVARGDGPVARSAKAAAKALAPLGVSRESAVAIRNRIFYAAPGPADEALTLELRRRFRDEVVALGECLDRDLVALWGYDELS